MKQDSMTYQQYLMACCASVFSPLSRLLPGAVLKTAGFSGWLSPLFAFLPLLLLVLSLRRLLTADGRTVGLAEGLSLRLGRAPGKLVTLVLCLWLTFYGGFLLRSGGERLLSTVYHSGKLLFFLIALLGMSTVFAMGRLRWAGRSAAISLLLFAGALILVLALALPVIRWEQLWPPDLTRAGDIVLSAVPVADVLSPWVYFSFLRGRVTEDGRSLRRSVSGLLLMLTLTLLFLAATIGVLGAELSVKQQFPFFIMLKNLTLFNVMERFDALILAIWMMTDYICIGMVLLSASEALRSVTGKGERTAYVIPLALLMLGAAVWMAPEAFAFGKISRVIVPGINLCLAFLLLPGISLLPRKKSEKSEK